MARRDPFQPRFVTSRRGGPSKAPLSRDAIVAAALDLLARQGIEGTSLRQVAAALDTGPATLYAYVEDVRELQALVLDRALGEVKIPAPGGAGWRHRLQALLRSYFAVLTRRPGLAPLAMTAIPVGPNALRIMEALLGLLDEAGVAAASAAWAVDLLLLYVTAIAAEHGKRRGETDPLAPVAQALAGVSAASHPRIHALRDHLIAGDGPSRFAWSIEVLIQGLRRAPAAAHPRPAPRHR